MSHISSVKFPEGLVTLSQGPANQHSLIEKLKAAKAAGFKGVEIFDRDFITSGLTAQGVRKICADLGLKIFAYQPARDVEGWGSEEERKSAFEKAKAMLKIAKELGAESLVVCLNTSPKANRSYDVAAEQLALLADEAKENNVNIMLEPLGWSNHNTLTSAIEILKKISRPNVGLVLDIIHLSSLGRKKPFNEFKEITDNTPILVHVSGSIDYSQVPKATARFKPISRLTAAERKNLSRKGRLELRDKDNILEIYNLFKAIATLAHRAEILSVSVEIFRPKRIEGSLTYNTWCMKKQFDFFAQQALNPTRTRKLFMGTPPKPPGPTRPFRPKRQAEGKRLAA